jgi:hypothetical protein
MANPILERIEKLLRLAHDKAATEHEAETAMTMARRIALEHDIELSRVDISQRHQSEFTKIILHKGGKMLSMQKFVIPILGRFFKVKAIRACANRSSIIFLVGRADDIETARYVYNYLMTTFTELWKKRQANGNLNVKLKLSYCMGLRDGLWRALKNVEQGVPIDAQEKYSLMVVQEKEALSKALSTFFKKVTTPGKKKVKVDSNLYQQGVAKGKEININSALKA